MICRRTLRGRTAPRTGIVASPTVQRTVRTLAFVASLLAGAPCMDLARAQSVIADRAVQTTPSDDDLEQTFWICDQIATRQFLGSSEAAICSTAFELLKQRRFNGSFASLLEWWRRNKEAAHAKLSAAQETR